MNFCHTGHLALPPGRDREAPNVKRTFQKPKFWCCYRRPGRELKSTNLRRPWRHWIILRTYFSSLNDCELQRPPAAAPLGLKQASWESSWAAWTLPLEFRPEISAPGSRMASVTRLWAAAARWHVAEWFLNPFLATANDTASVHRARPKRHGPAVLILGPAGSLRGPGGGVDGTVG